LILNVTFVRVLRYWFCASRGNPIQRMGNLYWRWYLWFALGKTHRTRHSPRAG
jgi:hypothetical protein